MKTNTNQLVQCPSCHQGMLQLTDQASCSSCSATYPIENQIINLLPELKERRTIAQLFMESDPIVNIYESTKWRRSKLFGAITGIHFDEEYQLIVRAGNVENASNILELACGPGIYLRPMARETEATVVGLDISFPMLRYASKQIAHEGLTNTVLVRGSALELPFKPGTYDLVNCCGALHLFPDVPKVLSEIHKVLSPKGRFTIGAFQQMPGSAGKAMASVRKHLIGVDSFTQESLASLLEKEGFTDIQCHHAKRYWLIMSASKSS